MRNWRLGAGLFVLWTAGCVPVTDAGGAGYVPPSPPPGAGGGSPSSPEPQEVPVDGAALGPWLEAGEYLSWASESAVHPSAGAHYGGVRIYVNPSMFASLSSSAFEHPVGAAAVCELYGADEAPRGWSVAVKVDSDSDFGQGWYWYERYDQWQNADGMGDEICAGCHLVGRDLFLSPFPLN